MKRFWENGEFKEFGLSFKIPLVLSIMVLTVIVFKDEINFEFNAQSQNEYFLKEEIEISFFGVVVKKDKDASNRNTPYFVLNDSSKYYNSFLWEKIQIGDSLSKNSGDTLAFIFRNKHTIIHDFYDEYEWRDSLIKIGKW